MAALENAIYELTLKHPGGLTPEEIREAMPEHALETIVNVANRLLQSERLELIEIRGRHLFRGVSARDIERLAGLTTDEKLVYKHIENSASDGIWVRTLKQKTNLAPTIITRSLKVLEQRALIKSIKSVKHPTRKLYMLIDISPSSDITGGPWYTDQEMDTDFINQLAHQCYTYIYAHSYPRHKQRSVYSANHTGYPKSSQIKRFIVENRITNVSLSLENIEELLTMLVYDGKIERIAPAFEMDVGGARGAGGGAKPQTDW
ncbi:34-kDa subunit of RNA polymerase III (C), partial [Coemansia sp. RSA 2320]